MFRKLNGERLMYIFDMKRKFPNCYILFFDHSNLEDGNRGIPIAIADTIADRDALRELQHRYLQEGYDATIVSSKASSGSLSIVGFEAK